MGKTNRARYTLEFKLEAVRLIGAGQSIAATAAILGLPDRRHPRQADNAEEDTKFAASKFQFSQHQTFWCANVAVVIGIVESLHPSEITRKNFCTDIDHCLIQ